MTIQRTDAETADVQPAHRFAIEYSTRDGRRLGQRPVEPDFQPARECARFAGVRTGQSHLTTAPASGRVVPVWSDELGPPYCRCVRVLAGGEGGSTCELGTDFFHELAREEVSLFVERGELEAGDPYTYRICAYPRHGEEGKPAAEGGLGSLRIEADALPIPLVESSLEAFVDGSQPAAAGDAGDAPVFIDPAVLEEACALAGRAGELETGGVLVGRLHRDRGRPEVFAEIAAQIPARHAAAGTASFAFTPETWAAADAALELRGAGELVLGWWHSHPRFCRKCPEERWGSCLLARPFFSRDDIHLHRTCFPQAYQLGLLISDLPKAGPTPALFGWRTGRVAARGYRVLRPASPNPQEGD